MEKKRLRELAAQTIAFNDGLREAQRDYERMARLKYELPDPLRDFEWVNPVISTAPYDAIRGATRALSNLNEVPKVHPATVLKALKRGYDDQSRAAAEKANEWEQVLLWNVGRAAKRRAAFRSSAIWSASLYNEVNAQVIHLPTQFQARGAIGSGRKAAALRLGDWAVRLVDPKTIAVSYSDYMPERVVGMRKITAQGLVDFWGDKAAEIAKKIAEDQAHAVVEYAEFDSVDYDQRYCWAVEGGDITSATEEGITILPPDAWLRDLEGNPVPFLPWINVAGGTDLDAEPEHQRKSILYPVRQAEQWAITNIFGTILLSLAQSEAAAPVDIFTGPGSEQLQADYSKPGGRINLTALQRYERIRRAGLDDNIKEVYDRIETAIRRSTVADILVTGSPAPNIEAAYAYNLQIQTALASLGDVKGIGEQFYEAFYERMLLICHYTGKEITGWSQPSKGKDAQRFVIDSEDIEPTAIYLSVELKADVPADRQQRIQSATQLVQSLQYSPSAAMEFLGEADPEGKLHQWKLWQIDLADLQGKLDRLRSEASGKYEQDVAQAAQAMLAQMQEAQAQEGMEEGGGPTEEMPPGGSPITGRAMPGEEAMSGVPGVEGEAFDVGQGGMPAAFAAPGATREQQTGEAAGIPLAGT
jgi:hypothetical protein